MAKDKRRDRIGEGFIALPHSVLDCPAFQGLSHPARSLLLDVARQFNGRNNGQLLASRAHLSSRGWKSQDVIDRAKRALLDAGLLFETVKGHRPNRASWYAITWQGLDRHSDYDSGAMQRFQRGAYRALAVPNQLPDREQVYTKWRDYPPKKNAGLSPPGGPGKAAIGPPDGPGNAATGPGDGPMDPILVALSGPSDGHHLEKPSPASKASGLARAQDQRNPRAVHGGPTKSPIAL